MVQIESAGTLKRSFAGRPEPRHRLRKYRICLEGYAVVALIAIIGFAAWHSGTNLVYLIFALMIAVFLVNGFWVWISLKGVAVERRVPRNAVALEETPVTVIVTNRRRWGNLYGIRFSDWFSSGTQAGAGFGIRIPARKYLKITYDALFPTRGLYKFSRIEITTRFPLGLVERGFSTEDINEVTVYPAMFQVDAVASELLAELGEREARLRGPGTDFYGLREYLPAEHAARRIHWRSSVKTGRLMVIEHEREELRRVTISLGNILPSKPGEELSAASLQAFETAVSLAASLASYFLQDNREVRLTTATISTAFVRDQARLDTILRVLATIQPVHARRNWDARDPEGALVHIAFIDPLPVSGRETEPAPVIDAREWVVSNGSFARRTVG